jgi:hypothetical protein
MAIANKPGDSVVIDAHSAWMPEWIAGGATIRIGGQTAIAECAMPGNKAKRVPVPETMGSCMRIGKAWPEARASADDRGARHLGLLPATHDRYGRELFAGKIVDLQRLTARGFAIPRRLIWETGGALEVTCRNENLVARLAGRVLTMVPDLISNPDHGTAQPITSE